MLTGKKLVGGLAALALLASGLSWWYRYESARRSTEFWGAVAAERIIRPERVTAFSVQPVEWESQPDSGEARFAVGEQQFQQVGVRDVTATRGMMHLGSLLVADQHYEWGPFDPSSPWSAGLVFENGTGRTTVLFSADWGVIGYLPTAGEPPRVVSCRPIAATLQEYFSRHAVFTASTPAE